MNWKYPRDEWLDTYKQEQTTYGTISPVTSVELWSMKAGLITYHPELESKYSKALRYAASRSVDLGDTQF